MTNAVTINLEALASGIGKQSADTAFSFYTIARDHLLETEEEREAFRYGALALYAGAANKKLNRVYYNHKFKKAMKQLSN